MAWAPADGSPPRLSQLVALLAVSGFASLVYELLWMRRFSLVFGSGALSVTLTVATLFGGMGLGGLLAGTAGGSGPLRRYAVLEALAALWALALPGALGVLSVGVREHPGLGMQAALVIALAGPPALALGATLPVVAGGSPDPGMWPRPTRPTPRVP